PLRIADTGNDAGQRNDRHDPRAPRGRAMMYRARSVRKLLLPGAAASTVAGCGSPERSRQSFDHRVLPPPVAARQPFTRPPDGDGVKPVRGDLPTTDPRPVSP